MFSVVWLAGHALLIRSTSTIQCGAKMQQNVVSAAAFFFPFCIYLLNSACLNA